MVKGKIFYADKQADDKKDAEENRTSQTVIPVISSVIRIQTSDMACRIFASEY